VDFHGDRVLITSSDCGQSGWQTIIMDAGGNATLYASLQGQPMAEPRLGAFGYTVWVQESGQPNTTASWTVRGLDGHALFTLRADVGAAGGLHDLWTVPDGRGWLAGGLLHGAVTVTGAWNGTLSSGPSSDALFWFAADSGGHVQEPVRWLGIRCGHSPVGEPVLVGKNNLVFLGTFGGCYDAPSAATSLRNGTAFVGVAREGHVAWQAMEPQVALSLGRTDLVLVSAPGPWTFGKQSFPAPPEGSVFARLGDDGHMDIVSGVRLDPSCFQPGEAPRMEEGDGLVAVACGDGSSFRLQEFSAAGHFMDQVNGPAYPAAIGIPHHGYLWTVGRASGSTDMEFLLRYRLRG